LIWYFLAGWIAGAVAVLMLLGWWARTHMEVIDLSDEKKEKCEDDNG